MKNYGFVLIGLMGGLGEACGGIADAPSARAAADGTSSVASGAQVLAKVSGRRPDAPAGARVALVWRMGNRWAYAVEGDVPLVNDTFTIELTAPDARFLSDHDGDFERLVGATDNPSIPPESFANRPCDGGPPTATRRVAVAGFVAYLDLNGNDRLDLEGDHAVASDRVIGGSDTHLLVYLDDGSPPRAELRLVGQRRIAARRRAPRSRLCPSAGRVLDRLDVRAMAPAP